MRALSGPGSRPAYYDRDPVQRNSESAPNPAAAPRAQTTDWTYTVPSTATKGYMEHAIAIAGNRSSTATNANAYAAVIYTPNGGTGRNLLFCELVAGKVSTMERMGGGYQMLLSPGDALAGESFSDNSAAGSNVALRTNMKAVEFSG